MNVRCSIRSILSSLLLCASLIVCSQNLVPNSSFEDTIQCPDNFNQVYSATGWMNFGDTPDYFNFCGQSGITGVPSNAFGYQQASTGNAYAGLWTFTDAGFYREYIGIQLTQPLIVGNTYFVSFKCATGSPQASYSLHTDKIGARFSSVSFDSISPPDANNYAHVYTDDIISDTTSWTTISGYYTADSNYAYIAVGNFFDDLNTDTANPYGSVAAYYYVDDVEVTKSTNVMEEIYSAHSALVYQDANGIVVFSKTSFLRNLSLFDYTGKKLSAKSGIDSKTTRLNIPQLATGFYFVVIETDNHYESKQCFISKP